MTPVTRYRLWSELNTGNRIYLVAWTCATLALMIFTWRDAGTWGWPAVIIAELVLGGLMAGMWTVTLMSREREP